MSDLALVYDTETSGLPLFNEPSEDPRQPHIVQLAACLVDMATRRTVSCMNVIVQPDGWVIPEEVAAIHGITTERALDVGIPAKTMLEIFMALYRLASVRIGHNEQFDARIVRIALLRHAYAESATGFWKSGRAECTQALSTPILKLPPTPKMLAVGRKHHKSANLGEAYRHFTGQELAGAHDAMVDVQACIAVYFAIKGEAVAA